MISEVISVSENDVSAVARIKGDDLHPELCGIVWFKPSRGGVQVSAEIRGLPKTETHFFGFHIHENGNCSDAGFPETGSHYNPGKREHPSHAGDLPPLLSCGGSARMCVMTDRFRVCDILGRSVVIHDRPDDFVSQPAGNAGNKIACGIICRG